jgi:hypothetical protein
MITRKATIKTNIRNSYEIIMIFLALLFLVSTARAESLFEIYSQKSKTDLATETRQMGRSLQQTFNATDISQRQMQIDFSEYRSNFKKALHYATRLASYSEYEQDLEFARDKEIFQGLPETQDATAENNGQRDKQTFMRKKYDRMQQNVGEEVGTYVDLLHLSLDACEALIRNDLGGFVADDQIRESMRDFVQGDAAREYAVRQNQLAGRWPQIAVRIEGQLRLWGDAVAGPNDPIINPQIVQALQ